MRTIKGSLYKRGNIYWVEWQKNKKRYRQSTGCTDIRNAQKKANEIIMPFKLENEKDTIDLLINKFQSSKSKTNFNSAIKTFVKRCYDNWSDITYSKNIYRLNAFAKWYKTTKTNKDIFLEDITTEDIYNFIDFLSETKSNKTTNDYRAILRQLWKVNNLPVVIFDSIPTKRKNSVLRRALTIEEITQVLNMTNGEMRLLIMIGLYTGMRLGDCCLLRWEEIDLIQGLIIKQPNKTKKTSGVFVEIPLFENLYKAFIEVKTKTSNGFILPMLANLYQRRPMTIIERFKTCFEKIGLETSQKGKGQNNRSLIGFHSLRITFVTMCAERGISLEVVKDIVGHTSTSMTEHYKRHTNLMRERAKQAIQALPKLEIE